MVTREEFAKLREAGLSVEQIAEFDRRVEVEGRAMNSPQAMTRRWLRALPFIGGAGAAALVRNPQGASVGAEIGAGLASILAAAGGGAAGRGAELGLGGQFPMDPRQAAASMGQAALEQGALQAPFAALGPVSSGLVELRQLARNRAIRQETGKAIQPIIAEFKARRSYLGEATPKAEAARSAAGAATRAEIVGSQERVTTQELIDEVVADREARMRAAGINATVTPKVRKQIENDVKLRLARVIPAHTGRLVSGGKTVFDMPESQVAKQAFDKMVQAAHSGAEGGIKPKPAIDLDIAHAWRRIIERKVPAVDELNLATQATIKPAAQLARRVKNFPSEEALMERVAGTAARTRQAVLAARSANPFQVYKGIPVRGGVATPGLTLKPGALSEFGGILGELGNTRGAEAAAFYAPRILALLDAIRNQEPAPPDTLPPPGY